MVLNFGDIVTKYCLDIKGIIHVGGHFGQEAIVYKNYKIKKVIFFEPLLDNYKILIKNIFEYQAINCALGADDQIIEMHVENDNQSQSSSILNPKKHIQFYPDIKFNKVEYVKLKTLDSFNLKNYNFLYMDVQGYELEVLKGGISTLDNIDYIMCEVNIVEHYENSPLIEDLDVFLKKYNFIRFDTFIFPQMWGDAFYMKVK
jgi:FkbM family methyltransferase